MLLTVTAIALITLADPPARKEPPTKKELAAITDRGRDLAGYDAAAWHASDAIQAKQPKEGSVVRYIARKTDKKWVVAFGRLDEKQEKFLIAYEATQGDKPDVFDVKEITPPKEDTGFFLSAARAIDVSLKDFVEHFEGDQRPYNVAVLPAEKGQVWVYLVPAPTKPNIWPLGGDVRYLISADGTKIVSKRQLHKSVIEVEPPKDKDNQQVAGYPYARSGRHSRRHGRVPCPDEEAVRPRDGHHGAVRLPGRSRRQHQVPREVRGGAEEEATAVRERGQVRPRVTSSRCVMGWVRRGMALH